MVPYPKPKPPAPWRMVGSDSPGRDDHVNTVRSRCRGQVSNSQGQGQGQGQPILIFYAHASSSGASPDTQPEFGSHPPKGRSHALAMLHWTLRTQRHPPSNPHRPEGMG